MRTAIAYSCTLKPALVYRTATTSIPTQKKQTNTETHTHTQTFRFVWDVPEIILPADARSSRETDCVSDQKTHQGELKMDSAGQAEFSIPNQTGSQTEYIMWTPPADGAQSTGDQ